MRIRVSSFTATAGAALLIGLLGTACEPDGSTDNSSSVGKSSQPPVSATPSKSTPSAASAQPTGAPEKSKQASASPSPSDSTATLEDRIFKAIDKAVKNENMIDIGVTNNSACDQSKGETLELNKFVADWSDGPYFIVSNYAVAPIELMDTNYTITPQKNGNPRNNWSFNCSGGATGYYVYRFVKIFEGGEVQVTEDIGITVSA